MKISKLFILFLAFIWIVLIAACGNEPKLTSIAVKSTAHKTEYCVGDTLDVSGLIIEAIYSDGKKEEVPVTKDMVSGFDSSKVTSSQTLTITYSGKTTNFIIKISQPTITSIAVKSTTHKTEYWVGDTLDVSGLIIEVVYSDGRKEEVSVTADMVSGFDSSQETSSKALTITYGGKSTEYNISVSEPNVTSIAVKSTTHKTEYWVGDTLDVSNLVIEVTYSDGSKENVNVTEDMVSGFDSSKEISSQTLTITYGGASTEFNISISEPTVTSIAVKSTNHKTEYWIGDALDVSGLIIEATFSNGKKEEVQVTEAMVSGFDSHQENSSQTLTITFSGKTAEFNISISAPAIISIAVKSTSHKTLYWVGEPLDVSGLVIEASYQNGKKENINVSEEMVSGFDSSTQNLNLNLTINYQGKTTGYIVKIMKPILLSIRVISKNHKVSYWVGEELDVSNLIIEANYSNGPQTIPVTKDMVSGFDSSQPSESQTLTITYEGETTTYKISIKAVILSNIKIKSEGHKTIYTIGEPLDVSNLVIEATYNNGYKCDIDVTEDMISGFDSSQFNSNQEVKINFENKTTSYFISIVTENAYLLADFFSYDKDGNPYQDPILKLGYKDYARSFFEIYEDNTFICLSFTKNQIFEISIVFRGTYQLDNETIIFSDNYNFPGFQITATFKDGKIIYEMEAQGSQIGDVTYPDYFIRLTYMQKQAVEG